jgi:hypothetical protein
VAGLVLLSEPELAGGRTPGSQLKPADVGYLGSCTDRDDRLGFKPQAHSSNLLKQVNYIASSAFEPVSTGLS